MHDLLGMEGPDCCLVELVLRDMQLHVRAALANSASVEPHDLGEDAGRFLLAAPRFPPDVLATARCSTLPGGGTPPSRGSGDDNDDSDYRPSRTASHDC